MKCPECQYDSPWTWSRYLQAPMGRTSCPACGVRLVVRHRWPYWLIIILGVLLITWPLIALGHRLTGSLFLTMVPVAIVTMLVVLPADKHLEVHFAFLKPMDKTEVPSNQGPPELETATEEELQEEDV